MPYASTPVEQTYPSIARRKVLAAEKREDEARRLRAEAADYARRWNEYVAGRDTSTNPVEAAS